MQSLLKYKTRNIKKVNLGMVRCRTEEDISSLLSFSMHMVDERLSDIVDASLEQDVDMDVGNSAHTFSVSHIIRGAKWTT